MAIPKLDRNRPHAINVHQADRLHFWDSPIHSDRQNLTIGDSGGNDVLTIYALNQDQLATLYLEIGHILGKSPEPTIHHLKQMHETLGELIADAEPPNQNPFDPEHNSF